MFTEVRLKGRTKYGCHINNCHLSVNCLFGIQVHLWNHLIDIKALVQHVAILKIFIFKNSLYIHDHALAAVVVHMAIEDDKGGNWI